jgi:hypothetical protein
VLQIVPKVKINISLHFSYLMTSNGRTTWPLVDCCTSNRRGQVDLQFDIQQSTNGALQSFHTAHSGTYWHIMPNSGTIRFLTGTPKKPTQPPKEGKKQTTTINGVIWHYCQKCFGGKGAWNKTHTTAEHVKGAGKGYKNVKDDNPPTPGQPSASTGTTESAVAHLASAEPEPVHIDNTNGLFFV